MVSKNCGTRFRIAALALFALLAGCGGGGDATGPDGLTALVRIEAEAPGAQCSAGGSRVVAGLDSNRDTTLDDSEASSTQHVCNGAVGSDGLSTLVSMSNEPAGANCASGGRKLSAGKDTNGNGGLDAAEVASTGYVCNGADGASGRDGVNSLIAVTAETAGAQCTYGGNKVASGLDTDADGTLDAGEVTSVDYLCHGAPGATGATGAAGPGVTWTSVTNPSVLAQANAGYLANRATQVTVTLPSAPAIGDVVRVSGVGSGGWKIAQQAGQTVVTAGLASPAIGAVWTPRAAPTLGARALASSADGNQLVAVVLGGQIHTSTDAGLSWTPRESSRSWIAVASSADGSRLVAAAYGGQIYTSTDSGQTWTARDSNRPWMALASSADGVKLVAAVQFGLLYTSTDSGATWTARDSSRRWQSVASSADGVKLVAVEYTGQIYTSTDSGLTWTARDASRSWYSVASSADGTKLVAAVNNGQIYTSADSGLTWSPYATTLYWLSVASSADGTRLVAVASGDGIHISTDSGATWTARDSVRWWSAVTSSADGTRISAAEQSGPIFVSVASTSVGVAGSISGKQYEAIELQYVGDDIFSVLSHVGPLIVQ